MRPVAVLVDHELPKPALGACGAKVGEVKGKHREAVAFRDRHHRRVGVSEVEVCERGVDLHRASQQAGREVHDGVLSGRDGLQEQTCGVAPES